MTKKDFLGRFIKEALDSNWNFAFVDDKLYVTTAFGKFILKMPGVLENDFEQVLAMLDGDREIKVINHMSRVVGYYSRTENWNSSKIGELKDRQKGNYKIGD